MVNSMLSNSGLVHMTELEIAKMKTETRVSKKVVIPMDSVALAVTCKSPPVSASKLVTPQYMAPRK